VIDIIEYGFHVGTDELRHIAQCGRRPRLGAVKFGLEHRLIYKDWRTSTGNHQSLVLMRVNKRATNKHAPLEARVIKRAFPGGWSETHNPKSSRLPTYYLLTSAKKDDERSKRQFVFGKNHEANFKAALSPMSTSTNPRDGLPVRIPMFDILSSVHPLLTG
jgi:hypothetical protein